MPSPRRTAPWPRRRAQNAGSFRNARVPAIAIGAPAVLCGSLDFIEHEFARRRLSQSELRERRPAQSANRRPSAPRRQR